MMFLDDEFKNKLKMMVSPIAWDSKEFIIVCQIFQWKSLSLKMKCNLEKLSKEELLRFQVGVTNICTLLGCYEHKYKKSTVHVRDIKDVAKLSFEAFSERREKIFIPACYLPPIELAKLLSKCLKGKTENEWLELGCKAEEIFFRKKDNEKVI